MKLTVTGKGKKEKDGRRRDRREYYYILRIVIYELHESVIFIVIEIIQSIYLFN